MSAARTVRRPRLAGRGALLALVSAAQFMILLDGSIMNMALPAIARQLSLSPAGLSWVTNAYVVAFGGLLLVGGRVADLTSTRGAFVAGLAAFGGASLAAALAPSAGWLIVTRAVQGAGAALLAPAALALLTVSHAQGPQRNRALAIWGAAGAAGGPAGAILGGILTGALGWRSVLLVNVPLCAAIGAAARAGLPRGRRRLADRTSAAAAPTARADRCLDRTSAAAAPTARADRCLDRTSAAAAPDRRLDLSGAAAVTCGVTALLIGLTSAAHAGWTAAPTVVALLAATLLLGAFAAIETHVARPLVPPRLVRSRTTGLASLLALLGTMPGFVVGFLLTLHLQQALGMTPLEAGLAFLPYGPVSVVVARVADRAIGRIGARAVVALAMVPTTGALALLATIPDDGGYWTRILPALVLLGCGNGLFFVAVGVAATDGVAADESGLAGGLLNMSQQLGAAIGLATAVWAAVTFGTASDPVAGTRAGFAAGAVLGALAGLLAVVATRVRGR